MSRTQNEALIGIVDDDEAFREVLVEILEMKGYRAETFSNGQEFMNSSTFLQRRCDLLITDIRMPGMSGFLLCEKIRAVVDHEMLPIIMITGANSVKEKSQGLNAGADDFIQKPFNSEDFLAKVSSLLGIKTHYQLTMNRVSKYISPNIAKLVVEGNQETKLKLHQADVSVLFCDLRGFTSFTEVTDPSIVMQVLNDYYTVVGDSAQKHQATLGHLAGDGIMLFLNDPAPIIHHQSVALQLAVEIRHALNVLKKNWKKNDYKIDFGIGIAEGMATLGGIGYHQFSQYSVIGPVVNFASRLCDLAQEGQILISHRFLSQLPNSKTISFHNLGSKQLKGIQKSANIYEILDFESQG
jgi:adenylate cyclase